MNTASASVTLPLLTGLSNKRSLSSPAAAPGATTAMAAAATTTTTVAATTTTGLVHEALDQYVATETIRNWLRNCHRRRQHRSSQSQRFAIQRDEIERAASAASELNTPPPRTKDQEEKRKRWQKVVDNSNKRRRITQPHAVNRDHTHVTATLPYLPSVLATTIHCHPTNFSATTFSCPASHWMFRSLLSNSLRVRRSACCMLLDGTSSSVNTAKERSGYYRNALQRAILDMCQSDLSVFVGSCIPSTLRTCNIDLHQYQYPLCESGATGVAGFENGDPVIQLYGLLSFLICDDLDEDMGCNGEENIWLTMLKKFREDSKTENADYHTGGDSGSKGGSTSLAENNESEGIGWLERIRKSLGSSSNTRDTSVLEEAIGEAVACTGTDEFSSNVTKVASASSTEGGKSKKDAADTGSQKEFAIEAFIASGGLRWATRSLVQLLTLLMRFDNGSSNGADSFQALSMPMLNAKNPVLAPRDKSHVERQHDDTIKQTRYYHTPNETQLEAIQTRIILLVDLVHRLCIFCALQPLSTLWPTSQHHSTAAPVTVSGASQTAISNASGIGCGTKKSGGSKNADKDRSNSSTSSNQSTSKISNIPVPGTGWKEALEKVEKTRRAQRLTSLQKGHDILWSSKIPSVLVATSYVPVAMPGLASIAAIDPNNSVDTLQGGNGGVVAQHKPLSPLACLIALHEVLKCGSFNNQLQHQFSSSVADLAGSSSTMAFLSGSGSNTNARRQGIGNSMADTDIGRPFLPNRVRNMDKCVCLLGKLVDPTGHVVVLPAVYPPPSATATSSSGGGNGIEEDKGSIGSCTGSSRKKTAVIRRSRRGGTSSDGSSCSDTDRKAGGSGGGDASASNSTSTVRRRRRKRDRSSSGNEGTDVRKNNSTSTNCTLENSGRADSNFLFERERGDASASASSSAAKVAQAMADVMSALDRRGQISGSGGSTAHDDDYIVDDDHDDEEMEDVEVDEAEEEDDDNHEEEEDGEVEEHSDDDDDHDDDDDDDDEEDDDDQDDDDDEEAEIEDEEIDSDDVDEDHAVVVDGDHGHIEVGGQFDDAIILLNDPEDNLHREGASARTAGNAEAKSVVGGLASAPVRILENSLTKEDRYHFYLRAGMEVLETQYFHIYHGEANQQKQRESIVVKEDSVSTTSTKGAAFALVRPPLLTLAAEQSLIQSLCDVVKPPKQPLNLRIFMRRAPTQEEFFRGSLSRNPITLASLKASSAAHAGSGGNSVDSDNEPRVRDLRQHIANDLQMSDSAELLELLVANKIVDMNLKLRVLCQVVWKKHVVENATSTTSASSLLSGAMGGGQHLISAGSDLSMVFSTGFGVKSGEVRFTRNIENTLPSSLPPMVVTYRLTGVDGEATEDKLEAGDVIDPEASTDAMTSGAEYEKRMENEYGMTRIITKGRGVSILLRSVESHVSDLMRRIRRDDVARWYLVGKEVVLKKNATRAKFLKSLPCPSLQLLRHCARLTENRKKMVKARAPTILLRTLLDVLNSIDDATSMKQSSKTRAEVVGVVNGHHSNNLESGREVVGGGSEENNESTVESQQSQQGTLHASVGNNPTADALQELIETLASDISAEATKGKTKSLIEMSSLQRAGTEIELDDEDSESTLPMLLSSLRTTSLSPHLRAVIAKLLPFLTYGQAAQSRALASNFLQYVKIELLGTVNFDTDNGSCDDNQDTVLMETFVQAAINLPAVAVCDTLRMELIRQGFVDRIKAFVLRDIPRSPPPWSAALFPKSFKNDDTALKAKTNEFVSEWRCYYNRCGLQTAFQVLIGLSADHAPTQSLIADVATPSTAHLVDDDSDLVTLVTACHWMESTSDNFPLNIKTRGLGLLAETLLDTLMENNESVKEKIDACRKKSQDRKKEISEDRRSKALVGMSSFGPLAGAALEGPFGKNTNQNHCAIIFAHSGGDNEGVVVSSSVIATSTESTSTSVFQEKSATDNSGLANLGNPDPTSVNAMKQSGEAKPAWMLEMEEIEDESGLTCAVCQEGRTLQPSELLGLYVYMKKVSIPFNKGGGIGSIDGTVLLLSLPRALPDSLSGTEMEDDWFQPARSAAAALQVSSHAASEMSTTVSAVAASRPSHYVTTVTAGTAIHSTCHSRARAADRNHPKAPKSEWDGASLRNSRVTCNLIFPLVCSKSSKVPMLAVESALADHQTVVASLLGSRPKSMLWTVLHDIRFLLLRISYGESLNSDCGGGSLASNSALLFYMMFMADMFAKDAEHDVPETFHHARELSAGFLAACDILRAADYNAESSAALRLQRAFADSAPMAAMCCILFFNTTNDDATTTRKKGRDVDEIVFPPPKRRWELFKHRFLIGLLRCAGRRKAQGLESSGCESVRRGVAPGSRMRARIVNEWDESSEKLGNANSNAKKPSILGKRGAPSIDDHAGALRPMITFYAILDQLSAEFTLNMDDELVDESAKRIVATVESCQKADSLQSLIRQAKIAMDQEKMLKEIERGIGSV